MLSTLANDCDQDFMLKESVPIVFPKLALDDTERVRNVCNSSAPIGSQITFKSYKGDTMFDRHFEDGVYWAIQ